MTFVHLHVHSSYSVLDGLGKPGDLVARVKELGMPAVALTDHGTMFGTLDFFKAAKASGIKPIVGLEAYLAARTMRDRDVQKDKHSFHLILIAQNMQGYQNLLKIATVSQLEGFYYHPRVDREYLASHSEGLIATSACISGEISRALLINDREKAERILAWYLEVFGRERFYLELQDHNIPELNQVNRGMLDLAKKYQAGLVATNDVHYIKKEDAELQDILLAVQTGKLLTDKSRMTMNDDSYYLKSPREMEYLFSAVPEAISNTLKIAEQCEIDLTRKEYHLPKFETPNGDAPASYLHKLCEDGLARRMPNQCQTPEVQKRLEYELRVVHTMGFDEYFLIVWDLCRYAKDKNIWYNARGSAAGSLVGYALDITSVEPLTHNLLFERFLNPGRVTMPDIDLDFQDDRRAEMLDYCNIKYGSDKVAQIITFGTMAARGAIRDVGRVMEIPLSEVDRVAKMIPAPVQGKNASIAETLKKSPELTAVHDSSEQMAKLIDTASRMEGAIRNVGTHAAGVIISDKAITEYLPLHRPTSQNEDLPIKSVAQYDMDGINELGLLKVDFLGLVTLTIMAKACEYIEQRHTVLLNLENIPVDDPEVFQYIGEGKTVGMFQLEGNGMTRYIMQMQPTELSHVIAMIALFRPGPMEIIPEYIERMHGNKKVTYQHEKLIPILKDTYGHAVYQEQIMQAAIELAGYSPSESDDLRSAISKKKEKEIVKHHKKFVKGAIEHGIDPQVAEDIFDHWKQFAHYGFNKSHAADYGVIAVQTGYLKRHYPIEYMTALLSAWKNDNDKCALYVSECHAMGIDVLPPDINLSGYDFGIEDRSDNTSAIRFGLGAIKNVGQNPVNMIISARHDGPFRDVNDFVRRVDLRQVGKRPLECLIKVGALDSFGQRHSLLRAIDQMVSVSTSHFRAIEMGQLTLFISADEAGVSIFLPPSLSLDSREQAEWEKELLGLYVTNHPLSQQMNLISDKVSNFSNTLEELENKTAVTVGGVVKRIRPLQTKTQKEMGFVTLEDNFGEVELVVFPSVWERSSHLLDTGVLLTVNGKVDKKEKGTSILVDRITRFEVDSVSQAFNDNNKQDTFFERILDDYLPDLKALSRYANKPSDTEVISTDEAAEIAEAEFMGDLIWKDEDDTMPADIIPFDLSWDGEAEIEPFTPVDLKSNISPEPLAKPEIVPSSEIKTFAKQIHNETNKVEKDQQINFKTNQRLVVTIETCGEFDKDLRRIRNLHGYLSSHPGDTHFSFCISESEKIFEIDFPNDTTQLSDSLLDGLLKFVEKNHLKIATDHKG